jgi:hypothetical protein
MEGWTNGKKESIGNRQYTDEFNGMPSDGHVGVRTEEQPVLGPFDAPPASQHIQQSNQSMTYWSFRTLP